MHWSNIQAPKPRVLGSYESSSSLPRFNLRDIVNNISRLGFEFEHVVYGLIHSVWHAISSPSDKPPAVTPVHCNILFSEKGTVFHYCERNSICFRGYNTGVQWFRFLAQCKCRMYYDIRHSRISKSVMDSWSCRSDNINKVYLTDIISKHCDENHMSGVNDPGHIVLSSEWTVSDAGSSARIGLSWERAAM